MTTRVFQPTRPVASSKRSSRGHMGEQRDAFDPMRTMSRERVALAPEDLDGQPVPTLTSPSILHVESDVYDSPPQSRRKVSIAAPNGHTLSSGTDSGADSVKVRLPPIQRASLERKAVRESSSRKSESSSLPSIVSAKNRKQSLRKQPSFARFGHASNASGKTYQTVVLANGSVLDLSDMSPEEAKAIFGKKAIHNIEPSVARHAVAKKKNNGDLKPKWNEKLATQLDDDSSSGGDGDTEEMNFRKRHSMAARASMVRCSSILRAVKKLKKLEVREGLVGSTTSPKSHPKVPPLTFSQTRSTLNTSTESSVHTLDFLPDLQECDSARTYVDERLALLRQSGDLRREFGHVCTTYRAERNEKIQSRMQRLEERRGVSHLEPINIAQSARSRDEHLAAAKRSRQEFFGETMRKRKQLVQEVKEKQVVATYRRQYIVALPLLIKMWQMNVFLFKTTEIMRSHVKNAYIRRWKSLKILYMFRWWVVLTRKRHARIAQLRFNMFIRRRLPIVLRKFRIKRRIEAIPMIAQFFKAYSGAIKMSRIIQQFRANVRLVQRFIHRRRVAKKLLVAAIQLQWDEEHEKMTESELAMVLPEKYRDAVIATTIKWDMLDYNQHRRSLIDDYISKLEDVEKKEVESTQRILREQQIQMATMLSSSETLFRDRQEIPTRVDLFTRVAASGPNATDIRRKFVVAYMRSLQNQALTAQYNRIYGRQSSFRSGPAQPVTRRQTKIALHPPAGQSTSTRQLPPSNAKVLRRNTRTSSRSGSSTSASPAANPKVDSRPRDRRSSLAVALQATSDELVDRGPVFASEAYRCRPTDLFDVKKLPHEDPNHPLHWLFDQVKPPKLPSRRMLTTAANVRRLIRMARENFVNCWRKYLAEANKKVKAQDDTEEFSPFVLPDEGALPLEKTDLSFIHSFLQSVK